MAVFESPDSKKCLSSTRVSHPYTGLLPQRGAGKLPMKGPRRQAPRRIPKCAILPGDSVQFEVGDDTVRPELPPSCRERLSWAFLTWIWTYPSRRRGDVLRRLAVVAKRKRVVILRSSAAIDEFLATVPDAAARQALEADGR